MITVTPLLPVGRNPRSGEEHAARIADCQGMMIKTYAYFQSLAVNLLDREKGQTMAEYAIVLAVITVAIIATLGFLAGGINKALSSVTSKL